MYYEKKNEYNCACGSVNNGNSPDFVPITYAAEDQVNIVSVESQTQSKWRNRI